MGFDATGGAEMLGKAVECDENHRRVWRAGFRMELLEDSQMPSNTLPGAVKRSLPIPCSGAGPSAGYGTGTGYPTLLVRAMLAKAGRELAASLQAEARA